MAAQKNRPRRFLSRLVSFVLLAFSLAVFVGMFVFVQRTIDSEVSAAFEDEAARLHDDIHDRLDIYTSALRSGRGFFDASEEVTREEWQQFASALRLEESYPGIQGYGYAVWIQPRDLGAHIRAVQAEGFPEYQVHPQGEREIYTAIIYLEPFDVRNQQAFGFDMFQEPTRRAAMTRARDTGDIGMTGKVTLVQEIDEDVQAGFLIYVPVYTAGVITNTVEARMNEIRGFVYSPFRMNNFMDGVGSVASSDINIEVFSDSISEENRMYGTRPQSDVLLQTTNTIEHGGETWVIRYTAPTGYGLRNQVDRFVPYALLAGGVVLSFLFFSVLYILGTRSQRAQAIAEDITESLDTQMKENESIREQLEAANAELRGNAQILTEKIDELERINSITVDRELKMIELKDKLKHSGGDESEKA